MSQVSHAEQPPEPSSGNIFARLCRGLTMAGVATESTDRLDEAERVVCRTDGVLLAVLLERVEDHWVLGIEWFASRGAEKRHLNLTQEIFAPLDSPGLRRLLLAVDCWLKAQADLDGIEWHRKERWIEGDMSQGAASPLDANGGPPAE